MKKTALVNGHIHTPWGTKEALLIEAGRISELGSSSDIRTHGDSDIVDLKGRSVFPGFHDSHMHFMSWARMQEILDLSSCRSIGDLQKALSSYMAAHPLADGEWYQGRGWNDTRLSEKRMPTRRDLDELVRGNPVLLTRICGHVVVVNTVALEILGITAETRIPGGTIELDPYGEPNGILTEEAAAYAQTQIPGFQDQDLMRFLEKYGPTVASFGLTQLNSDDLSFFDYDAGRAISFYMEAERDGKMPFRLRQQFLLPRRELLLNFLAEGWRTGDGTPFYQIGPLKLLTDGSMGGRTAFMQSPYADVPEELGVPIYEQEELDWLIDTAHAAGMQVATHAIGDGALEMCLNAIEHAQAKNPRIARHLIVHSQIAEDRQLERMKELRVGAAIQPSFVPSDREMAISRLGNSRASANYRWKTMMRKGIVLSGGSDAPIENLRPLHGIHAAVTRQDTESHPEGGWSPEERLSVSEALALYTWNGAWNGGAENRRGEIAVGKDADLVVLEEDPYRIPPEELFRIEVAMTFCGGKATYIRH